MSEEKEHKWALNVLATLLKSVSPEHPLYSQVEEQAKFYLQQVSEIQHEQVERIKTRERKMQLWFAELQQLIPETGWYKFKNLCVIHPPPADQWGSDVELKLREYADYNKRTKLYYIIKL